MLPNILYNKIPSSDEDNNDLKSNVTFPWSRLIVNNENAILSPEEAKKVHAINCSQYAYATFSGGIQIPGNADLEIFDTISIDDSDEIFYITGISHSYSSSSRVWTTSLQITHIPEQLADLRLTLFTDNPNKRDDE